MCMQFAKHDSDAICCPYCMYNVQNKNVWILNLLVYSDIKSSQKCKLLLFNIFIGPTSK